MATNTPNLGLRQPAGTDYVQVLHDISNSMGKIDDAFGNIAIYSDGSYSFSSQAELNSLIETLVTSQEQYKEYKYKLSCANTFGLFINGYVYCANVTRAGSPYYITVTLTPVDNGTIKIVGGKRRATWNWGMLLVGNEGTWTPNLQRATASTALGKYKKIGNLYICSFYFDITAVESSAPYINGSSLPGYTSSVIWSIAGTWSSTANEFGTVGNTSNNNVWFAKGGQMYGLNGCVGKAIRGMLIYIV